jgi:hypothetical protein
MFQTLPSCSRTLDVIPPLPNCGKLLLLHFTAKLWFVAHMRLSQARARSQRDGSERDHSAVDRISSLFQLCSTHSLSSTLFHSLLFSSTLFHSLLFSSTHFHSLSFSSILFHSLPLYSILFRSLPQQVRARSHQRDGSERGHLGSHRRIGRERAVLWPW